MFDPKKVIVLSITNNFTTYHVEVTDAKIDVLKPNYFKSLTNAFMPSDKLTITSKKGLFKPIEKFVKSSSSEGIIFW